MKFNNDTFTSKLNCTNVRQKSNPNAEDIQNGNRNP